MINHSIISLMAGITYDSDAEAFFTATGITDTTIKNAVNQLVLDLKGYSLWTKLNAIYPMVGGTSTTCKYNLKDPQDTDGAYRLSFAGGWTFASTGAKPNGSTGVADTHLNIGSVISNTAHSFGIYSRTNNTSGTQVYGVTDLTTPIFLQNNLTSANFGSGTLSNLVSYTASPTTRFQMATRRSSTDFQAYRDGTSLGTNTTSMSTIPNSTFRFGGRYSITGTAYDFYSLHEIAFAFIGQGLTNTESGNLRTAVDAFQLSLSRNV